MNNGRFTVLWESPAPSQQSWRAPWVEILRSRVRLCFDYEGPNGGYRCGALQFSNVRAFKFIDAFACRTRRSEAYEKLIEIANSDWVGEIQTTVLGSNARLGAVHHYQVYFDDVGLYDIAAESWGHIALIDPPPVNGLLDAVHPYPPDPSIAGS